jgi:hypothetical protein
MISQALVSGIVSVAGQIGSSEIGPSEIGPKSNRPQVKSAPDQIIVLLCFVFFIVSHFFFTPGNHMSANFVVYYCQHTKLNIS